MAATAAVYSYIGDFGRAPQRYVLRADPVHLRTDTRGLVLFDTSRLSFNEEESRLLSASVDEYLRHDGWTLEAAGPGQWYLCGDTGQELRTHPLFAVRGELISDFMPAGKDAAFWLQRLNEIQMLMYSHPVNQNRAQRGAPAINSLWLWGGGEQQGPVSGSFTRLCSDSALLKGLAITAGIEQATLPDTAEELLDGVEKNEHILILLDLCSTPASYQEFPHWNSAVEQLDRTWFKVLNNALARRRIHRLELFPLDGYCYSAGRFDLRRFWKSHRTYRAVFEAAGIV